jgi:hypothetical protein
LELCQRVIGKLHISNAIALPFQSKYFFRCSAGQEPGRRLYAVRVRVLQGTALAALCRCVGVVTLASWRHGVVLPWRCYVKIFTTLRSATLSSSSTLVRERNPCVRSMRVRI